MSDPAGPACIAGLILAGGASRRMGTPKALLRIGSQTFVDRLVEAFSPVADPVIVVLGHDSELLRRGIKTRSPVLFALNAQPERGMLTSLQCGLRALPQTIEAVIFTPVDYPNCKGTTIAAIANTFRGGACDVVIPVCRGMKGHPVCISRRVIGELLELSAVRDARDVIRRHRDATVFVEVDDPGITTDVDTPEDYRNLLSTAMAVS